MRMAEPPCISTRGRSGPVKERLIGNEDELASVLSANGFRAAYVGTLRLSERVALLAQLDAMVTQSGANEFNLLFAREQPRCVLVIEAGRAIGSPFWRSQLAISGIHRQIWPTPVELIRFPASGPRDEVNVRGLVDRVTADRNAHGKIGRASCRERV